MAHWKSEEAKQRSLANLRPRDRWKAGVSGNPSGRPKGATTISGWIKKLLNEQVQRADGEKVRVCELIARTLIQLALKPGPNQLKAIEMLLDRTEGKAIQHVIEEIREDAGVQPIVIPPPIRPKQEKDD